jgi:LysM repeat protein
MRAVATAVLLALAAGVASGAAEASTAHVVQPGETLSGIAAANGTSASAVAAANGLAPDAHVILGTSILVPDGAVSSSAGAVGGSGGYMVQPGDTLSGIAARYGVSTASLAGLNGLDAAAPLLSGTTLQTAGASVGTSVSGEAGSAEIAQLSAQHGVSGSLATAIAWQESGFNNGVVSSAHARGVMQVMPVTWQWIEQNLAGPLDPASPQDNVRAGSLYLAYLLRETGGDERLSVAAYYQGLASVRERGLLPETQQYVDNVMALRARIGG